MAGYSYENWKSNNAIEAEEEGLLKAGELAKELGVSTAAVKACACCRERHHVGGGYAIVAYYAVEDQSSYLVEQMQEFDSQFRPRSILDAKVTYLEWPAFKTGRWAKNRNNRPTKVEIEHCRVTLKSPNTVVILTPAGEQLTKRTSTKGLVIEGVTNGS